MATGIPGADSSTPVSTLVNGSNLVQLAQELFGATPAFWGRYFTSVNTTGTVEYRHAQENQILSQANIRLLPIARQTTRVGGSFLNGATDAMDNVQDFITTFGQDLLSSQGGEFLMFLDVEGTPANGSPSLSLDYYTGWAQNLVSQSGQLTNGAVTIQPCVYARQADATTWETLISANNNGVPCFGGWVARYYQPGCQLQDWDNSIVLPAAALPFDVLIWQYAASCAQGEIDCNQSNPTMEDIQSKLLSKLVLPPA
jgi:hypothetical protein